ncbi:hypothetical protein BI004_gp287 [Bacillus phage NotTheCreek]|uniref:Uncharacterized protein n=1 Tax=Bacillus phage PPIsBest TaxID=2024234 RepID=A0A222Z116_9CAUD|nr:hypothetical protein BI004_gp287 [Bacillus phage NotTheCreek]AMW63506.1 hypothetical protein NOTTHECREEK_287 [Bacillus phage NotTheCreek]ASR78231.1 hypothetical protein PPISBEST_292 [Bacillus phage PPIsBest]QDH49565.1 hypothetical protein PHIREBALL_291 [Bacillus phage Phireball]QDH50272.1 hypothetical protein ALPS_286 [Bacillus phage ALPS]
MRTNEVITLTYNCTEYTPDYVQFKRSDNMGSDMQISIVSNRNHGTKERRYDFLLDAKEIDKLYNYLEMGDYTQSFRIDSFEVMIDLLNNTLTFTGYGTDIVIDRTSTTHITDLMDWSANE